MKLYVRKQTKEVAMRSASEIVVDTNIFDVIDYAPSEIEQEKFAQGKACNYTDNQLVFLE